MLGTPEVVGRGRVDVLTEEVGETAVLFVRFLTKKRCDAD